jgi:hypothetical protein
LVMSCKVLSRRGVAVLVCLLSVAILGLGCKKKEEQAIPRAPVTPQAPEQTPQTPGQPPQAMQQPAQQPQAQKQPGQAAPHGTMAPKTEKSVVVPDDVKKKWNKVKLVLEDKNTKKTTEYAIKLGSDFEFPGTDLKVSVGEFLPDFRMDEGSITSASSEPNNPAVRVEVFEKGKSVFKGWLYVKFPAVHPFEHQRYNITFKEAVKA